MSYQSFFIGFVLLSLLLAIGYLIVGNILERRGSILFPMVELYVALLVGLIYSVVAMCISTSWIYPVRVLAGLGLGVVVGWALMMAAGLLMMLFMSIFRFQRE